MFKKLLIPFSWLYALIVGIRNWMYDKQFLVSHEVNIPTICVGNLVVGGTGKTPHTEYLIRLLKNNGYKVAVLSRGYKRKTKGFLLANEQSTAFTIGDESMQIHTHFPDIQVAVCKNRVEGIQKLLKKVPDIQVVVLDDAYQHRSMRAGFYLLLTASDSLYVHDYLLPFGRLREPAESSRRANMVVVTKCHEKMKPIDKRVIDSTLNLPPYQSLVFSQMQYAPLHPVFPEGVATLDWEQISDVLLVVGIAQTSHLVEYVKSKVKHVKLLAFADHYAYTTNDFTKIQNQFSTFPTTQKYIITTEKDEARMKTMPHFPEKLKPYIFALPMQVNFGVHTQSFDKQILSYVKNALKTT